MEEVFKDTDTFSTGIRPQELMNRMSEFPIDVDLMNSEKGVTRVCDDELIPNIDEDRDTDNMKVLEDSIEAVILSCPEYKSFDDISSKMIDCMPSGDVKMMIFEDGCGPLVPTDAIVNLHYAAYFEKETIPFDSSLSMNNGNPIRLQLGRSQFIPGLEIGLSCVHGPKARVHLMLTPRMAWGEKGALPRVRPERALFVIQLYDVTDAGAPARFNDLPMEEQRKYQVTMETVKSIHSQAKELYKIKKYDKAVRSYKQSLYILNISEPKNENEANDVKLLKIKAYSNLAVCYYQLKKPKHILSIFKDLDYITDTDKQCKILFYYGRAYQMLNKHEDALLYYKKGLKLEPHNKEIGVALKNLDEYYRKSAENEKQIWRNAFKTDTEVKLRYSVDESFQKSVLEMCQNMAGTDDCMKFDLPSSMTKDEIECIKDLSSKFEKLVVLETEVRKRKNVSIVKIL